jgi:hypothetical protein
VLLNEKLLWLLLSAMAAILTFWHKLIAVISAKISPLFLRLLNQPAASTIFTLFKATEPYVSIF